MPLPFLSPPVDPLSQTLITQIKAKQDAEAARLAAIAAAIAEAKAEQKAATDASKWVRTDIVAGNNYDFGNCTWYVALKREVPAGLGNARDWLYNAQAMGMLTGTTPRVGAVAWAYPGWTLGHVAYVEAVYPDSTFLISEMNVVGFDTTDTRIVTADGWQFIY